MHFWSPSLALVGIGFVLNAFTLSTLAEAPPDSAARLILGELTEWKLSPRETASVEIAEVSARVLLRGPEGEVFAAMGQRTEGGRVVVFADRACLDGETLEGPAEAAVLNSIRWAGKNNAPRVGLGQSLAKLAPHLEEAGMRATVLKTSDVANQVDVYCLAVRPEGGVFGEGREALDGFLKAGGGLVLAGTGPQEQLEYFNSVISPAGIRFTGPAEKNPADTVALRPEDGDEAGGAVMSAAEIIESLKKPESVEIPADATGPTGAAVRLKDVEARGNAGLIGLLLEGANLKGDDLTVFQEALHQLNLAVGPIIPTKEAPIIPGKDPLVDAIVQLQTEFNNTLPAEQIRAIPAASDYPGAVSGDALRVAKNLTLDANYKGWLPGRPAGFPLAPEQRPTGLYAAPGEVIQVTVPKSLVGKGYTVIIGNYKGKVNKRDQWYRYPDLWRAFPIESTETRAANGFGGTITIGVPPSQKGDRPNPVDIEIQGGVEAPLYVLGETDLEEWRARIRTLSAPWAELASERMILTLPSEYIRTLDNPDEVMTLWNEIVEKCAELAVVDRHLFRAERIAFDRQTSAGALHSGHAIGAHTGPNAEIAVNAAALRKDGNWGFLHELGHNHQHNLWALPNTVETTCNLWSVYVSEEFFGISRDDAHRACAPLTRRQRMDAYFKGGANFEKEWSMWVALESYLQVQEAFGWEPFKKVFADYNAYQQGEGPKTQQEKNDEWVRRLSQACGRNLAPFYQTWGLPLSDSVVKELAALPEWVEDPVKRFRGS